MKAPIPMPPPAWLLPVEPATTQSAGTPVLATIIISLVAVLVVIGLIYLAVRAWSWVGKRFNFGEPSVSEKLDALASAVVSLEGAVTNGVADISHAAQLFKDNAAASVQLEQDEAVIAALTARVDAAAQALNGADAELKSLTEPAPAPSA